MKRPAVPEPIERLDRVKSGKDEGKDQRVGFFGQGQRHRRIDDTS
jgi:hypothetical protein